MTSHDSLEVHEMAKVMPEMSEEEHTALTESIKDSGVVVPIIVWRGKIVEGRTRYGIASGLGMLVPQTELPDDMPEQDVRFMVVGVNLCRRNLTSSQRAAIAVEMGMLDDEREKNEAGRIAERVAVQVGTNYKYLLVAEQVRQIDEKVFAAIKKGDISIAAVAGMLEQLGKKDVVDVDDVDDEADNDVIPFDSVVDAGPKEKKVPSSRLLRGARARVTLLRNEIKVLIDAEEAVCLDVTDVIGKLSGIIDAIKAAEPFAVCPECSGKDKKQKTCAPCHGLGWVTKSVYKEMTE